MDIKLLFEKAQELRNNGLIDESVKVYSQIRAECVHQIGVAYYQKDKFDLALKHLNLAKVEFEEINNTFGIGNVLRDLGLIKMKMKKYKESESLLRESIKKLEGSGNKGHIGISKVKLGLVLAELGDSEKGEKLVIEGIKLISQSPNKFFESTGYFDLAQLQAKMGKKIQAKQSLKRSLQILNQTSGRNQFSERRKKISELDASLN